SGSADVELPRDHRDSIAEVATRLHIGRVHLVGVGVHIGLSGRAQPEAEAVEVVLAAGPTVPAGAQTQTDPVHMVLGGEYRQRHQGVELVAALGARVREPCRDLVAPRPVHAPTY